MTSAALATVFLAAPAMARAGPRPAAGRLSVPTSADQLIVVSSPTYDPAPPGYLATVRTYERPGPESSWRPVFAPRQAETGYGHLRDVRREGDGSTPTGVYGLGAI